MVFFFLFLFFCQSLFLGIPEANVRTNFDSKKLFLGRMALGELLTTETDFHSQEELYFHQLQISRRPVGVAH